MKTRLRPLAILGLAVSVALAPLPVLAQAAPPVPAPETQAGQETQSMPDAPIDENDSPLTLLMGLGIGLALGGALAAIRRRASAKTPKQPRRKDLLR